MGARLHNARGPTDRSQATTTRPTRSVTTQRPGNRRATTSPDTRSGATCGRSATPWPAPHPLIRPGGAAVDHFGFDHLAKALASHATRRSSLGLFAAGLLGLTAITEDAAAKKRKKKHKKRKRKQTQNGGQTGEQPSGQAPTQEQCQAVDATCVPGQSPSCCAGLQCDQTVTSGIAGTFCCAPEGTSCTTADSCCSGTCDFLVGGGTCAPCRGRSCSATQPCCGGQTCSNGYCGGCRDRATSCTADSQCCFSNCTGGACLSALGGRCARDVDCRSCYLGHNCSGACVNGSCAI
jgi:hypothetical protein